MITARARTPRPSSQPRPTQRPSASSRLLARACSTISISGSCAASAESSRTTRRPVALPPECTTRRANAALQPERERAAAVGVEPHAQPLELADAIRCLGAEDRRGARADETAPGVLGVGLVQLRAVVRAERCRKPTLRPIARGLGERRGGDQRDARAGAGGAQRGEQTCRARTDDRELGLDRGGGGHWRVPTAMSRGIFFSHPASAEHDTGDHPERAARIVAIERQLDQTGGSGSIVVRHRGSTVRCSSVATPPSTWRRCSGCAPPAAAQIDADTLVSEGSWEAALRSAGGAVAAVDAVFSGEASAAFAAGRPPGHHALRARAMGFCLFNNVAVAALHALTVLELERVLILDWDVHHGNGTNDLFHSAPEVLYASIHEQPLYPGTGPASDRGSGAGEGFTLNLPVAAGSGDDVFGELVHSRVIPRAREYRPQLILISAGYDAHVEDPLADCVVTEAGYAAMTAAMRNLAEEVQAPLAVVLEGGYALGALARSLPRRSRHSAPPVRSGHSPAVGAEAGGAVVDRRALLARGDARLAQHGNLLAQLERPRERCELRVDRRNRRGPLAQRPIERLVVAPCFHHEAAELAQCELAAAAKEAHPAPRAWRAARSRSRPARAAPVPLHRPIRPARFRSPPRRAMLDGLRPGREQRAPCVRNPRRHALGGELLGALAPGHARIGIGEQRCQRGGPAAPVIRRAQRSGDPLERLA